MVDTEWNVQGVIDWEGACTLPWELIEMPAFLETVPRELDAPGNYDENGEPVDDDVRQTWKDRRKYADLIAQVDRAENRDDKLSSTLKNAAHQRLAYAVRAYTDTGKEAFYDAVTS